MASAEQPAAQSNDPSHNNDDDDDNEFFGDEPPPLESDGDADDALYTHGTLCVRQSAAQLPKDTLLYLYARFKFAGEGACCTARPGGLFNFEAKSKWDSWKALPGDYTRARAKQEYVAKLDDAMPDWRRTFVPVPGSGSASGSGSGAFSKADQKGTFGVRMSVMALSDDQLAADQCAAAALACGAPDSPQVGFELCKTGQVDQLAAYLERRGATVDDIDRADDAANKMTMLMWACDRGHVAVCELLVRLGADLDRQDADGQTALHYACACEHADVVDYLVRRSERPLCVDRCDNDGQRPRDLTSDPRILALLPPPDLADKQ